MMPRLLLALALLLCASGVQAQDLPPAYPRPGAVKMLENDDVIVWNIAWLKQEYPMHRHRYDHTGVYYRTGDRVITSVEGVSRPSTTPAWNISFQLRDVTHMEAGASDEPLRAVFIQMKRERRGPAEQGGDVPAFPVDGPRDRLDNDRVHVWEYGPGSDGGRPARHRHANDAVVVSFDDALTPSVRYVERGTVHESDRPAGSTRTFVFEIR